MTLPNFYILGAQKCGTTWLAAMLRQHPEVFIPAIKEVNFYNRPGNFQQGFAWYEQYFEQSGAARAIGDATPQYLAIDVARDGAHVVERIRGATPDAKFIISLRDPVTRAVSGLLHAIRSGNLSARTDLDATFQRMFDEPGWQEHILNFGNYRKQIQAFLTTFPIEQFLFLVYEEDIVGNKAATLRNLCEFLGVRGDFQFSGIDTPEHPAIKTRLGLVVAGVPPRIVSKRVALYAERLGLGSRIGVSDATIRRLYEHYRGYWDELGQMIGRDLAKWNRSLPA
jgi:hypothetical protein